MDHRLKQTLTEVNRFVLYKCRVCCYFEPCRLKCQRQNPILPEPGLQYQDAAQVQIPAAQTSPFVG